MQTRSVIVETGQTAPSGTIESHTAMSPSGLFARVEAIGRALPEVTVTTSWGQPALKVRGKMFACGASHKSAEPDTLVVMMDPADRTALIEDEPATFYLKEHYVTYPCVLVRLSRIQTDALRDLLAGAHRFVVANAKRQQPPTTPRRRRAQ